MMPEAIQHMDSDQVIVVIMGLILVVGGIGLALARTDRAAREKDERRFGELSMLGLGMSYWLFEVKWFKWVIVAFMLGLGGVYMASGFGLLG